MVIAALLVQWPTIPSLLMAPALFRTYVRLAHREEREMEGRFGEAYRVYKGRVPAFVPCLNTAIPSQDRVSRDSRRRELS